MSLTCKQLPLPDQALLYGNLISRLTDAAVFLIAQDGRILSWNPGVQRILGYTEDEWLGQPVHSIFTPEDCAVGRPEAEIELALRDGQAPGFRWHLRKDKTRFFAEGSVVALRDENGQLLALTKIMRDVTRRKQRELALKDALAYTEGVVNTVREPLLVLDAELRVQSANRSFYQVFGLTKEAVENQPLYDVADREWDLPKLHQLLEEIFQQQDSVEDFELEHVFPRIGRKIILLNGRKLLREGAQTQSILLAFEDITERKRTERELKENERRQAALVAIGDQMRQIGDVRSLVGSSLEIVVNTLGVSRAGYATVDSAGENLTIEDEWGDGTVSSIAGHYRVGDYGDGLSDRFKRGEFITVTDVRTNPTTMKDSDRWEALQIRALINVPLLEHGRLCAMLFLHSSTPRVWKESDLSFVRKAVDRIWSAMERERALQELKRSEEFTRSILASSPDFVSVLDLDGRLITIGQHSGRIGSSGNAETGASDEWAQGWGDSKQKAEAALASAREGQTTRFEATRSSYKRKPKWWEVVVAPIYDGLTKPVRILSLARDITERKYAEHESERLTVELRRSNNELLDFAHIVAHDLQAPLRGVSGFAELVHRNARERLSEEDSELLEVIVESAKRMGRLVDSLLRYAQVGNGDLQRAPVDMNELLDATLESLQAQLEEGCASVIGNGNLPSVMGESVQLLQLLQNLIGNALKYARPHVRPEVTVSSVVQEGNVVFAVADNGEGIPPEYLIQIFQPLKRLHGSDIPGTGLGLAVCDRIVQRHGGRIWVHSELNVGSTFYFSLPAALS